MNEIYLDNTFSKKREIFIPLEDKSVKFYYCGPTVYWTQHIGNLRGAFCADLVRRVFEYNGYKVIMVRNFTDVGHLTSDEDEGEDKLEKGAKREGLSPIEIANKYIKVYLDDVKELNLEVPAFEPRATEHIKEMIDMVKTLLDKGFAYQTDLAIYFDVAKFPDYTHLSKQKLDKNIEGAGKGEISDPGKKNSFDFALWFFRAGVHKNALQYWSSPFVSPLVENGNGFPGWHIECSAMSKKYLGPRLDVHMGGVEHISVHHTNEIAQSESANGETYANYWLHNEHLMVDGGKMSKSQGTGFSLNEIKNKGFSSLDLRFFFLQAHYRSKQNFTWEALAGARSGFEHLKNQIRDLGEEIGKIDQVFNQKFLEAVNDDINVPQALALAQELLKSGLSNQDKLATILEWDRVYGLDLKNIIKEELPEEVLDLIKLRNKARFEKDWMKSDELRQRIESMGYVVKDQKDETVVYKI